MIRKKFVLFCIMLSFACSCLAVLSFCVSFATPDKIYIKTEEDFKNINNNLAGYYVLQGNFSVGSDVVIGDIDNPFTGTIDGQYIYRISIDERNYSSNNTKFNDGENAFFGLIPFNKGVLIHCQFVVNNFKYTVVYNAFNLVIIIVSFRRLIFLF